MSGTRYTTNAPYLMAQPVPGTDLVAVVFHWHTVHGTCQECGLPAAYTVSDMWRACCVCAAVAAAGGADIQALNVIDNGDETEAAA